MSTNHSCNFNASARLPPRPAKEGNHRWPLPKVRPLPAGPFHKMSRGVHADASPLNRDTPALVNAIGEQMLHKSRVQTCIVGIRKRDGPCSNDITGCCHNCCKLAAVGAVPYWERSVVTTSAAATSGSLIRLSVPTAPCGNHMFAESTVAVNIRM